MSDFLVAAGLRKTYSQGRRDVEVLRGIDLHVRRGEVLVIVGASGAGKSTLLHLLGGLDRPTDGEVLFEGTPLKRMDRTRWRNERVGFVFQSYNLLLELDALENVCVPALVAGRRDADRGRELLGAVGLSERVEHRPAELSGGEQQRVAIARAIVGRASAILADEPTAALDSENGHAIMEVLAAVAKDKSRGVLVVTHDPRTLPFADRIVRIEDGRIVGEERGGSKAQSRKRGKRVRIQESH
jgi:putative ABC transport system ATP-binding protein